MPAPLLTILMTAATARAEATEVDPRDGPKHRVSASLGLTPLPGVFATESNDGWFPESKDWTLQTSVEATYGFRPLRHLEIGVGLGYRHLYKLKTGESYAHTLRVPAHAGVGLDVLLGSAVDFEFFQTTNGNDYVRDLSVMGLSILPLEVGVGGRW